MPATARPAVLVASAVLALVALSACTTSRPAPAPAPEPEYQLGVLDVAFGGPLAAPDPQSINGDIPSFVDPEGYTYDISFRLAYSDVAKDISQSPPGRARTVLTADFSAVITNTTAGRVAPLGNLDPFRIGAAFPAGSAICGKGSPGLVWESNGALASYCLVFLIPSFLPETGLESGATYNANKTVQVAPEDTEANVDLMVAELAAGPSFWLAVDKIQPGLVNSCDGGPGTRIQWLSAAIVSCPGAVVASAPTVIDGATDMSSAADSGFDRHIRDAEPDGRTLQSCPLGGDRTSITTGLASLENATGDYAGVYVNASSGLNDETSIECLGGLINIWATLRDEGTSPLQQAGAVSGSRSSAEFPYLGGSLLVWCDDGASHCHPLWYDEHIVLAAAGAVGGPQEQLDWFIKDLPTMLTNLAAAS